MNLGRAILNKINQSELLILMSLNSWAITVNPSTNSTIENVNR